MRQLGKERFHSLINKLKAKNQESQTSYGVTLSKGAIPPLCKGIQKWFESSTAGYNKDIAKFLVDVPNEVLADLTCRVVLDCISVNQPLTATAMKLGSFIEEEARLRSLKKSDPDKWNFIKSSMESRVGFKYKKYSSRSLTKRLNLQTEWEGWGKDVLCRTGLVLINLFQKHTGLVALSTIIVGQFKKVPYLVPTEKTKLWIQNYKNYHEFLTPLYLPSSEKFGYQSFDACTFKVSNPAHLELLDKMDDSHPYLALRKLQSTPWRINAKVLETAEYFWENQYEVAGFPKAKDNAAPAKPVDIETNKEAREAWRKKAAKFHKEDIARRGLRLSTAKILWVAGKFRSEPAIYFPHQFDFRGRAYPVPNFLNFQAGDLSRGLLEFSEGKPLTKEGEKWFLKYGYTLWGNADNMLPHEWLRKCKERLHLIAEDPAADLWWSGAEEPWQFLAWALEASKWMKGELKESHMPISIDASSNGLQIMSMLLKYEKGAEDTNCIGRTDHPPKDIYSLTLESVKIKLESNSVGWDWLSLGLNRSLVKSIIMTLPYGCTQYKATELIIQWYWGKNSSLFSGRLRKAADYLAFIIIDSFYKDYPEFSVLMSYMEALGKSLGAPLVWLSPSGFPVVQDYKKTKTRQVKSLLFGRIRSFNYNAETEDVDTAKMGRAFVPNFIHSLDASVMHIALSRTKASSVAAVHDSFSTHACDMDELLQTLRDTNADMFSADPKVFWKKFFSLKAPEKQVLEDTVDSFSSMFGKLNVDGVRVSAYMYR